MAKPKQRWVPEKGWVLETDLSPDDLEAIERWWKQARVATAKAAQSGPDSPKVKRS